MKGWAIERIVELAHWAAGTGDDEDEGEHAITIAHGVTAAKLNTALGDAEKLPCKFALIVRFLETISTLCFQFCY